MANAPLPLIAGRGSTIYDTAAGKRARGAGGDSLFSPSRGQLLFSDPMSQIGDTAQQAGNAILDTLNGALEGVVGEIFSLTGIDLSSLAHLLEQLWAIPVSFLDATPFGSVLHILGQFFPFLNGFLADPLSFDPFTAAQQFIELILNPTGLFTMLPDLVQALTGIVGGGIAEIEAFAAQLPLIGELVQAFTGLAGGTMADLATYAADIPLLGPLVEAIAGVAGGGMPDLTSFFGGFTAGIPFLEQITGSITGVTGGGIPDLSSFFGGFTSGIPMLDQFVSAITGLTGGGLPDLSSFFANVPLIGDFIAGLVPISTDSLFGLLPANLFSLVPISALADTGATTDLLALGAFPAGSIQAAPDWDVDTATTYGGDTTGSARVHGDGVDHGLRGIDLPVGPGKQIAFSARALWSGLTSTGTPIRLGVVEFNGVNEVGRQTLDSISAPGAAGGWTQLAGTYTAPSSGVTSVRVRLVLTSTATAGTVHFDDVHAYQSGQIQQDWVQNLTGQFGGITDMFGLSSLTDLIGLNVNDVWTNLIGGTINPLGLLANLVGGLIPGGYIGGFDASKIISGFFSMSQVTNLLGFLNLFAGGSGTLGDASNMVTNLLKMWNLTGVTSLLGAPGSFNPSSLLSTWISALINPLGLLAPLISGFISAGIIPGLDGSKIQTGTIATAITQLQTVIDAVVGGTTGTPSNLGSNLSTTASNLIGGFANIYNAWFNTSIPTATAGDPAHVNTTVANMRTVVINGYTLATFGSNTSWTVPSCSVLYLGAIGAGGRGYDGISGNSPTAGFYQGGKGGSSGGVQMRKLDPVALGIIGSSLSVTVGSYAVASSPGANGGQSSFGYVSTQPDIGKITTPEAEWGCAANPGRGGDGGYAQVACGAYFGTNGANGASAFGGSYGNQSTGTTSATGSAGSQGGAGVSNTIPISGGAGGGGGGGACATAGSSTSSGGAGGAGGFPGGGGGGGGGATATTPTPGAGAYGANGMCWALYK